jgi:Na+/melibiose symporter-like transporter
MIDRYLLILLTVLLVGSLGAFFLLVPILPMLVVSVMLVGLLAMFWLGLHVARPPVVVDEEDTESRANDWTLSEHA